MEKHLIFKKILNQNAKSASSFSGFSWSIRKGVAAKGGVQSESSTVGVTVMSGEGGTKMSLSREQFGRMADEVSHGT